jgi:uncharacterized protein (TIGR02246 family)
LKRITTLVAQVAILSALAFSPAAEAQEAASTVSKTNPALSAQVDVQRQAVLDTSKSLVEAYNKGDADALANLFCPAAELVDDAGNVFKGREEIGAIYTKFIEQFPGAKMELQVDSLRFATSEIAIEDGTRTVVTADGDNSATNRYTMVYVKRDDKWSIASARELPDDPEPTPHDYLQPLAWLVGDWVDEGAEQAVAISCRWADSGNFLLLDFDAQVRGETVMKSTQRIGWDAMTGRLRSWVFDSDGGYGRGDWAQLDDRWIIKSTAVLPSGVAGSATIVIQPDGDDKFTMSGYDRVLGNAVEPDFEAVIVRKPPQPSE